MRDKNDRMTETLEKLPKDEAEKILKNWADHMELDTTRQLFTDLVDELSMPVRLHRLDFDIETEKFKYQLINPVNGKSIVEIKECNFAQKRVLQKYKEEESIDAAGAMICKYTNLNTSDLGLIKDRDVNRINAVIMGFLAQTAPSRK